MAEPLSLHVVVRDLDDEFGAQWHEREVLARIPAAAGPRELRAVGGMLGPASPRVRGEVDINEGDLSRIRLGQPAEVVPGLSRDEG